MNNMYYMLYDSVALPVSREKWRLQEIDVRRVAESFIGKFWISTVFMGLNHGYDDRPLLYETMVFETRGSAESDSLDEYTRRYTTWGEAQVGHREVVKEVRERKQ